MSIRLLVLSAISAIALPAVFFGPDETHTGQKDSRQAVRSAAAQNRVVERRQIHVSPRGSDHNSGDRMSPVRTIARAAQMAEPGSTIYVAPGIYRGGFQSNASGTPSAPIRFVSAVKWGAKIVADRGSESDIAWDNRGDYVSIEGFEIDGRGAVQWRIGIYAGGSYNTVSGNRVHHIANRIACRSNGGAAIIIDHYYGGKQGSALGNIVHHIGRPGCQFVHGIYVSTSGSVKNNLVFQVGSAAIHLWHDASSVSIAHNTVFASEYGIVVGGGDYYHTQGPANYIVVANNIFFDNAYGMVETGDIGSSNAYINNLAFGNTQADTRLITRDYGTIRSDPAFIAYVRSGGGNYRLHPTSPAIAGGDPAYRTETDIEGRVRAEKPDIGAFESERR